MSNPTENSEQTPKKSPVGKIIYLAAVALMAAVLLVSAGMFLWEQLPEDPAPTEGTVPTTAPVPTVPEPVIPKPTVPEPVIPEPTDPQPSDPQMPAPPDLPAEQKDPDIRLKAHAQPVSLLGQAARDYLAAEKVSDVTEFLSRYWETESRSDRGRPVELSYSVYALPEGVSVESAVFRLYVPDGSGRYSDHVPAGNSRSVLIYNLRTGTEYRYSAVITLSDGKKMTLPGSFKTAAGPRLMYIDGIVNVRDLGGWVTTDGKTVRQGLLYRGSELDGMVEKNFKLTAEGLEQMKALGIRTDFDLRHEGNDVLGPDVKHICYNAIQYEHAFSPEGREAVRKLFADLADPENYPAYLHCTYGADRTGTMCYLLLGLLGVDDADLKRDYELTALYYGYVSPAQMDRFVEMIAELPGSNTRERVEYFLGSTGVTKEQMESIRQIFLG